jgi:outer membrane protein assembly factor BamA
MSRTLRNLLLLWTGFLAPSSDGWGQERYLLEILRSDKDTPAASLPFEARREFRDSGQCRTYLNDLLPRLRSMGHIAASIDSSRFGAESARAWVFIGETYRWESFAVPSADLEAVVSSGWKRLPQRGETVDLEDVEKRMSDVLGLLADMGHPFASVRLDSISAGQGRMSAMLRIDRGPLYRIDSITVDGGLRVRKDFLHRYLEIPRGGIYRKEILDRVSTRLMELPWLKESRPWDLAMLGTGSTLNLHLEPLRNSQVNLLVGFLPDNSQIGGKLLLTGEASVRLRNAMGAGEGITAEWQQIQVRSPRLRLAYDQPYLFGSPFGVDLGFDLFRKDSSFVNLNARIGLQYLASSRQRGVLFFQPMVTNLLDVDTVSVKATRTLPAVADVSASNLGVDYRYNGTDYVFNPRRGLELEATVSGGWRRVRENPSIASLKTDAYGQPFDFSSLYDTVSKRSFQFRLRAGASRYIQTSERSTLKAAVRLGWIAASRVFRNEAFQIGGYRLLRGFDEESIFATAFGVGTLEYRYLLGRNSYMYAFTDFGATGDRSVAPMARHFHLGLGVGLSFETKAGIFNLAYAAGKRDDLPFDLRQSKIHFGLVSLF